ncbi:MAG: hypothetical protein ACYTDX_03505 [Planctomycetota bacterium]
MNHTQNEMIQSLGILQEVYGSLVERLTDAVQENEDALRSAGDSYSFAAQDVEDRFGPRIINLSHLINALQAATTVPTKEEFRFEQVLADAEELAESVNDRVQSRRGWVFRNLNLQKTDDGRFLALITLSRCVNVRD